MRQIFYLGGGEAKENFPGSYYDFLAAQAYDPYAQKFTNWKQVFRDSLDFHWIEVPFPNEMYADYQAWHVVWQKHLDFIKHDDIIIACSLGGGFLLKFLQAKKTIPKVDKIIFLAPGWRDTPAEKIGAFAPDLSLVPLLENFATEVHILHSQDDPVVPYQDSQELHEKCLTTAQFHSLKDHGHFYQMERISLLEQLCDK